MCSCVHGVLHPAVSTEVVCSFVWLILAELFVQAKGWEHSPKLLSRKGTLLPLHQAHIVSSHIQLLRCVVLGLASFRIFQSNLNTASMFEAASTHDMQTTLSGVPLPCLLRQSARTTSKAVTTSNMQTTLCVVPWPPQVKCQDMLSSFAVSTNVMSM